MGSNIPKRGGESGRSGEVGQLSSNALEEETRQALTVDRRYAGWCEPSDQPESNHVEIPPQPISLETVNPTNQSPSISSSTKKKKRNERLRLSFLPRNLSP